MLKLCSVAPAPAREARAALPVRRRRLSWSGLPRGRGSAAVRCSSSSSSEEEGEKNGKPQSLSERLRMGRLEADGFSYKESFTVRSYEVDANMTATIDTISKLIREVASNDGRSKGLSRDGIGITNHMRMLQFIWVMSQMHIEIYKYPAWGDVVEIETWLQGGRRIGARYDYILKDLATGELIGRASSKLVLMNQDTRKLQRVSDEVRKESNVFLSRTPRLAFPEQDIGRLKIPKLEDPAQYSRLGLVHRRADLDINQHVNNVTYIGWVLESIPQEIIDTHELQTLTIDYRRECQLEDMVDSLTSFEAESEDNVLHPKGSNGYVAQGQHSLDRCQFLHCLRLSGTGLEISRGRTVWRRRVR